MATGARSISVDSLHKDAGVDASVGSTGDSDDNAMAETIIGLFTTEKLHARGRCRTLDVVEYATLEWVDWCNNCWFLESIGHVPPAEFEAQHYRQQSGLTIAA